MKRDREGDDALAAQAAPSKTAANGDDDAAAPATTTTEAAPAADAEATPAHKLVNLSDLLEVVDNDVDFALELITESLGEFAGHVTSMRGECAAAATAAELTSAALVKLRNAAHSVKGVAGNLAFERLQASAADLERWARAAAEDSPDDAAETATTKVDALGALLDEVKTWAGGAREALEAHPPS